MGYVTTVGFRLGWLVYDQEPDILERESLSLCINVS